MEIKPCSDLIWQFLDYFHKRIINSFLSRDQTSPEEFQIATATTLFCTESCRTQFILNCLSHPSNITIHWSETHPLSPYKPGNTSREHPPQLIIFLYIPRWQKGPAFYNHCNINNTKHNKIADDRTKQYYIHLSHSRIMSSRMFFLPCSDFEIM